MKKWKNVNFSVKFSDWLTLVGIDTPQLQETPNTILKLVKILSRDIMYEIGKLSDQLQNLQFWPSETILASLILLCSACPTNPIREISTSERVSAHNRCKAVKTGSRREEREGMDALISLFSLTLSSFIAPYLVHTVGKRISVGIQIRF